MPLNKIILALYLFHFILYSYLNVLYVAGFPLRSLVILMTGMLVIVSEYRIIKSLGVVNYIYAVLSLLGLIISFINDLSVGMIVDGELKLLQSYLVILVSYFILEKFGFKFFGIVILIIGLPTALVGILQGLNIEAAWTVHDAIGVFMDVKMDADFKLEQVGRSPGLANFAIPQVSLLLCLIFITCYFILAIQDNIKLQYLLLFLNLIFVLAILASQTRSALGASLITLAIVYFKTMNYKQLIPFGAFLLITILIFTVLLGDSSGNSESRLVGLNDQSAKDKLTLTKYSIELITQQPFGYGFNFDTMEYARTFFLNQNTIFDYDVFEKGQYLVPVHNATAHIVITYGFFGLILLFIYLYHLTKFRWYQILFVSSVLLNSSFHNMGILNGDLNIDMIFAIFLYEKNLGRRIVNLKHG